MKACTRAGRPAFLQIKPVADVQAQVERRMHIETEIAQTRDSIQVNNGSPAHEKSNHAPGVAFNGFVDPGDIGVRLIERRVRSDSARTIPW